MSYDVVNDYNYICEQLPQVHDSDIPQLCIAQAINHLAYQVQCLGLGNASTDLGAIEHLAVQVKEGLVDISTAIANGLER